MAVSIILTSCGKSAGLSNGGKKADNKIPVVNANTKSQPQKNNDTGNKTLANDTSTKNLPQKIDNNIKQSWTDDHMFEIISISVIAIAIAIGSIVWIIKNKSPQTTEPPEAKGQPQTTEPPKMIDVRRGLGRQDYETIFLSYPSDYLEGFIKSVSSNKFEKQYASAELERRKLVPFSIPDGVDLYALINLSVWTNDYLARRFDISLPAEQQTINFIFECRKKID
jgi:hypothetical protein